MVKMPSARWGQMPQSLSPGRGASGGPAAGSAAISITSPTSEYPHPSRGYAICPCSVAPRKSRSSGSHSDVRYGLVPRYAVNSVPAEIPEYRVRTRTCPGWSSCSGASMISTVRGGEKRRRLFIAFVRSDCVVAQTLALGLDHLCIDIMQKVRYSPNTPTQRGDAMRMSRITKVVASATLLFTAAALTGCSNSAPSDNNKKTITVWSQPKQPERVNATKTIIEGFTKKTGIKVKLVPVDENQIPQLVASAAISGSLPDVMGAISLSIVRQLDTQKLLNTDAAANVVTALGEKTFVGSAL